MKKQHKWLIKTLLGVVFVKEVGESGQSRNILFLIVSVPEEEEGEKCTLDPAERQE